MISFRILAVVRVSKLLPIRWPIYLCGSITGGTTRIGLTDVNNKLLIDWDWPLFRDCGRHARSFSGTINRAIAETVTGVQFRTVGNVPGQRC